MDAARPLLVFGLGAALCSVSVDAAAYRPFDGTDADVAKPGEFELELGPAQYYRRGTQAFLVEPALVLNLGVFENTELVIDAQHHLAAGARTSGAARLALRNDDVLLKHVFREGSLQGKTGLGIAAEGGVLTPEVHGNNAFGASLSFIGSYAWPYAALHLNECLQLTRERQADLFSGVIGEGPLSWQVRPVAEAFYERDATGSRTASLLVGVIWTAEDSLTLDLGLRGARVDDLNVTEARLGLTWAIALWLPPAKGAAAPH